jgi:hypothetical protein
MSRRRAPIELEEIPTLKQAYEERKFSPRNLKRTATRKEISSYILPLTSHTLVFPYKLYLNIDFICLIFEDPRLYEYNEEYNKKISLMLVFFFCI